MEEVVLLSEEGTVVGTAPKATVHDERTPLHLAFSCYVFDDAERLLLTRRAASKLTWPAVWTNTVCGHPAPGEAVHDAVLRRAQDELGLELAALRLVLPGFRYRAVMAGGTVENEMCPVFVARPAGGLALDPAEVDDTRWVPWRELVADVAAGRQDVSPWCAIQLEALGALGPDPAAWPAGDPADLPPAARP